MNTVFYVKKVLLALLEPVPLTLLCLLVGLVILIVNQKKYNSAVFFISCAFVILILFSTNWLPNRLIGKLEGSYPPCLTVPQKVSFIVVLGAGNYSDKHYSANMRLTSTSLARLLEAVRLYHQQPDSDLVLSGGPIFNNNGDAEAMYREALILNIKPSHLILDNKSSDTQQQAIAIKKIVMNKKFILVTSAYHMPRAMKLFKKQDLHPIPAPAHYIRNHKSHTVKYYFPNSKNLLDSDIAIHEYLGLLWIDFQDTI